MQARGPNPSLAGHLFELRFGVHFQISIIECEIVTLLSINTDFLLSSDERRPPFTSAAKVLRPLSARACWQANCKRTDVCYQGLLCLDCHSESFFARIGLTTEFVFE